jgi:transcriptional regulator with XRE-family HTH domain
MDAETILLRLGQQCRTARTNRGLTQVELADMAGLPRLKVIHIEAGKPTVSVSAFARVASALGVEFSLVPSRRPTLEELPEFLR